MSTFKLQILAAAATMIAAGPAIAQPLSGPALQSRVPGSEIRVNYDGPRGMEDHVWRLQSDGSVSAVYMRSPIANDRGGAPELGGGTGRWTIQGNQLCIDVSGIMTGRQACFAIDAGAGNQVTLVGGNSLHVLRGTMTAR